MSILGILFMISGIFIFFNPEKPKPSTPNNTPSEPPPLPYAWAAFSGFGVLFVVISGVMYFLATDNSDTTKNILAAQGVYDAYSFMFPNRRNGGNFAIGE